METKSILKNVIGLYIKVTPNMKGADNYVLEWFYLSVL